MSFGKWLYNQRKEARLTQGELARRAHISTSYVSTLEREQEHTVTGALPQPDREIVIDLAKVLNADIDEALLAAGYAPKNASQIPAPILEAIGRNGTLTENENELVANFIDMLGRQRQREDDGK